MTNKGLRFNSNKLAMDLIPIDAKIEIARVYTVGAAKYDRGNWLKGMDWSTMIACSERHFALWQCGLSRDEDTKCHHLALAAWNLIALLVYEMRGLGTDDRTKLPIDENFNWIGGPAVELDLGMTPEEINNLREKYSKVREAALSETAKVSNIGAKIMTKFVNNHNSLEKCLNMLNKVDSLSTHPSLVSCTYEGNLLKNHLGDYYIVDGHEHVFIQQDVTSDDYSDVVTLLSDGGKGRTVMDGSVIYRDSVGPKDIGKLVRIVRTTKLFGFWHIASYIKRKEYKAGRPVDINEAIEGYTETAVAYSNANSIGIDMATAKRSLHAYIGMSVQKTV